MRQEKVNQWRLHRSLRAVYVVFLRELGIAERTILRFNDPLYHQIAQDTQYQPGVDCQAWYQSMEAGSITPAELARLLTVHEAFRQGLKQVTNGSQPR